MFCIFSTFLEECKWDSDRIEFFNKIYAVSELILLLRKFMCDI